MEDSKISKEQRALIEKAILNGDAHQLEQFLIAFKDDDFVSQWNEILEAHSKEAVNFYEKACAVIAYKHHFNNWPGYKNFKEELNKENSAVALFEKAIDAVVEGDIAMLKKLLQQNPELIHVRSVRNHHATLLNYVGANGVEDFRQKTPLNAVEVAEILLNAGAEVDAMGDMYRGTTTLGLVATSVHPVEAGVQKELVDVLVKYGADINHAVAPDYTEGKLILACLHNGRGEIVEHLAEKGADFDLEGAAGTGILDEVKKYYNENGSLKEGTGITKRDSGFMWACGYGRKPVVEFMLDKGFDVSTITDGMTALHWAVVGGHVDIIQLLLEYNAPLEIKNSYGGTVLGQALWFAYNHPRPQYPQIIDLLIKAGAKVEDGWDKYIDEIKSWYA
ncbi:MAG TPA: ankyrin repeat domain-containing protein [Parafilimonas sp.]|nr:ankyrin repeat domain-containing protein [Parafilimonas sp.]